MSSSTSSAVAYTVQLPTNAAAAHGSSSGGLHEWPRAIALRVDQLGQRGGVLDAGRAAERPTVARRRLIGDQTDVVSAIVTYDAPTEKVHKCARYALRVNGVLQPGG